MDHKPASRRILIVEDEYFIAAEMAAVLANCGVEVLGPVGDVEGAKALLSSGAAMDGAFLDINLDGEPTFAVADALRDRNIPFVFATGYGQGTIPSAYHDVPRWEKPLSRKHVLDGLTWLASRQAAGKE